jgi:hypothetical protein
MNTWRPGRQHYRSRNSDYILINQHIHPSNPRSLAIYGWPWRAQSLRGVPSASRERPLLTHSPAAHVQRPRLDYESHAVVLDRNELRALLVAAELGLPPENAPISLPALNGLRVAGATGNDSAHQGLERGHRTLTITRESGKIVTIPLAPRTAPGDRPSHRRTLRRPGLPHLVTVHPERCSSAKGWIIHTLPLAWCETIPCNAPRPGRGR